METVFSLQCLLWWTLLSCHHAHSLRCYCTQSTALGLPRPECIQNLSCSSSRGCYHQRFYSDELHRVVDRWECVIDDRHESTIFNASAVLCNGGFNSANQVYKCCFSDYCNRDLGIVLPVERRMNVRHSSAVVATPSVEHTQPKINPGLVAAIAVPVALTFLVILFLSLSLLTLLLLRRQKDLTHLSNRSSAAITQHSWDNYMDIPDLSTDKQSSELPYLVLNDIKDVVKLSYRIENGRFGSFYHGYYDGQAVAAKRFEACNKYAWLHESIMYNRVLQKHDNILLCFASAMVMTGAGSELWLITKYHDLKSLQDYLRQHTVTPQIMIQMAASLCSGLAYLHSESSYNQPKPPVAHCNLNSKNVLVKNNLSCCIGDFRLAVFRHRNEINMATEAELGTVRYMAPEMLNGTMNLQSFESFKSVDVYALGLVLWEICKRTARNGGAAEPYQVPFQGLVPPDASLEDMKMTVVTNKQQPVIPNKWSHDELLSEMTKVMRECWYYTSTARPTAVYLKKKLLKMSQNLEKMSSNEQTRKGDCTIHYGKISSL